MYNQISISCHFGILQMAPMGAVRGSLGAVSLNGHIWAIGGGEPGVSLETVEMYDPIMNAWMPGRPASCESLRTFPLDQCCVCFPFMTGQSLGRYWLV